MPRLPIYLSIFLPLCLLSQDTISVTTTAPMFVCSPTHPESTGPCAKPPRAKNTPDPEYSEEARRAGTEGTVVLWVVVNADGSTGAIKISKSLDKGLDAKAVEAVKKWTFTPGTYEGKAVPVQINIEVNFRLGAHSTSSPASSAKSSDVSKLTASATEALRYQNWNQALTQAQQLLALDSENRFAWHIVGYAEMQLGQLEEAEKAFKKQVEVNRSDRGARFNLALVYSRLHRPKDAIDELRKYLALFPDDAGVRGALGSLLADQKLFDAAVPELTAALATDKDNAAVRVSLAKCLIEQHKNQEAVEQLELASQKSATPTIWNNAAYTLATHKIELDRALKWAQTAVSIQNAELRNISLNHISADELDRTRTLITYWDTLGWVYFVRAEYQQAERYLAAGFDIWQDPTMGEHLAHTYEELGRKEDAARVYSVAIAAEARLKDANPEYLNALKEMLGKVVSRQDMEKVLAQGETELLKKQVLQVQNANKADGDSDFVVTASSNRVTGARAIEEKSALASMADHLKEVSIAAGSPDGTELSLARAGTLHCHSSSSTCEFALVDPLQAPAWFQRRTKIDAKASENGADAHAFQSASLGIRLALADDWRLLSEVEGSYSRPATAIFGKPGALVSLAVLQEHLESTPALYERILIQSFDNRENFKRTSESEIVRDGISGKHWNVQWSEKGIAYRGFLEFYTSGDQHFRIFGAAADEVYQRYTHDFDAMLKSIAFPLLHVQRQDLIGSEAQK